MRRADAAALLTFTTAIAGVAIAATLTAPSATAQYPLFTRPDGGAGAMICDKGALSPVAARIRQVATGYALPEVATRNGYLASPTCIDMPGTGGLGYRYVKPSYLADGAVNLSKPEGLVYVPTARGLRLGAVEYLAVDADQDLGTDADRPKLLGQPFDGPMPGRDATMPVHYELHVWGFIGNPAGVFATFNPRVTCTQWPASGSSIGG